MATLNEYIERELATQKAARAAQRMESRKVDLPFTKPANLRTQSIIDQSKLNIINAKILAAQIVTTGDEESAAQTEDTSQSVKLDNGDLVDKTAFDNLPLERQALLKQLGVDAYNAKNQEDVKSANEAAQLAYYRSRQRVPPRDYPEGVTAANVAQMTTQAAELKTTINGLNTQIADITAKAQALKANFIPGGVGGSLQINEPNYDPNIDAEWALEGQLTTLKSQLAVANSRYSSLASTLDYIDRYVNQSNKYDFTSVEPIKVEDITALISGTGTADLPFLTFTTAIGEPVVNVRSYGIDLPAAIAAGVNDATITSWLVSADATQEEKDKAQTAITISHIVVDGKTAGWIGSDGAIDMVVAVDAGVPLSTFATLGVELTDEDYDGFVAAITGMAPEERVMFDKEYAINHNVSKAFQAVNDAANQTLYASLEPESQVVWDGVISGGGTVQDAINKVNDTIRTTYIANVNTWYNGLELDEQSVYDHYIAGGATMGAAIASTNWYINNEAAKSVEAYEGNVVAWANNLLPNTAEYNTYQYYLGLGESQAEAAKKAHTVAERSVMNVAAEDSILFQQILDETGDYAKAQAVLFETKNIQLSNGDWVDKIQFNAMPPDQQTKLTALGVKSYNAEVEAANKAQQAVLAQIQPYGTLNVIDPGLAADANINPQQYTYTNEALAKFIIDNRANGAEILKSAGFSEETIAAANILSVHNYDELTGFYELGTAPNSNIWQAEYVKDNIGELLAAASVSDITLYNEIKDNKYATQADYAFEGTALYDAINKLEEKARLAYETKYGVWNRLGSETAGVTSMVFAPARALAPDVMIKDISGAEWVLGGAQALMTIALPVGLSGSALANIVGRTLMAGATAASTAYTVMEWHDMSTTARTLSVIMDVVLGVSTFGAPFVKWLKTTDFEANFAKIGTASSNLADRTVGLKAISDRIKNEIDVFYTKTLGSSSVGAAYNPRWRGGYSPTDVGGLIPKSMSEFVAKTPRVAVKDIQSAADWAEYYTRNPNLLPKDLKVLLDKIKARTIEQDNALQVAIENAKRGKITASDINIIKKATGRDLANWTEREITKVDISSPAPSTKVASDAMTKWKAEIARVEALQRANNAAVSLTPASLKGYTAIIPAVDAPLVNWKPYLPATTLAKLAASVNLVMSPALTNKLYNVYSITPDNLTGVKPLTNTQIEFIAKTAGLTQTQIDNAVGTQTLAQVAAQALIKAAVLPQEEVEALALALAQTATNTNIGTVQLARTSTLTSVKLDTAALANTDIQTATQAVVKAATEAAIQNITKTQILTQAQIETVTKAATESATQVVTKTLTQAESLTQEQIDTALKEATELATQTAVDILTEIDVTVIKPPPIAKPPPPIAKPPPEEPIGKPPPIIPVLGSKEEETQKKREEFTGAVTWRQGIMYHAWKSPYEDDETDLAHFWKYPPPGAILIPGAKKAQETLQLYLGDTPPPPDRIIHMGIMDINISSSPDGKLNIKYTEDKEQSAGKTDWFGKEKRTHTHKRKVLQSTASSKDEYLVGSV